MAGTLYSPEAQALFKAPEWRRIDDQTIKISDVIVHTFRVGDVEDPDLYAGESLYKWQQSEAGKWITDHAIETPFWHRIMSPSYTGYEYHIVARLKEQDELYWTLKWNNEQS